jgi:hypothetical protein
MFRRRLGSSALRVVLALDHHPTQPSTGRKPTTHTLTYVPRPSSPEKTNTRPTNMITFKGQANMNN